MSTIDLGHAVVESIRKRGLIPGEVVRDQGFLTVRIKDDKGRVISAVTVPQTCGEMSEAFILQYIDGLVLERCRAGCLEPILREA